MTEVAHLLILQRKGQMDKGGRGCMLDLKTVSPFIFSKITLSPVSSEPTLSTLGPPAAQREVLMPPKEGRMSLWTLESLWALWSHSWCHIMKYIFGLQTDFLTHSS